MLLFHLSFQKFGVLEHVLDLITNDRHVNTTESLVCGLPKTPSATTEPTTAESPSSITPTMSTLCKAAWCVFT
jgi:hypothetical protein